MGKTYRKIPTSTFRKPKGKKQAIINNARKGAIPPSAWDDKRHNDECYDVYTVAYKLIDLNLDDEEIHHKLVNKFHIPFEEAVRIVNRIRKWY